MSQNNNKPSDPRILTAEQEAALLEPITLHLAEIQKKIDALRLDGEEKIVTLKNKIQLAKENKALTSGERSNIINEANAAIAEAKKVEAANKSEISALIAEGEAYLKDHFKSEYYDRSQPVSRQKKKLLLPNTTQKLLRSMPCTNRIPQVLPARN